MEEYHQKRKCTMARLGQLPTTKLQRPINSQPPTSNAQLTPNAQLPKSPGTTPNRELGIGNWEFVGRWGVGRWELTRAGRSLRQECARPRSGGPAAQHRVYLALLPSGPDAVRRLNLHRVRTAVRRILISSVYLGLRAGSSAPSLVPGTFRLPLTFYKSGAILSIIY